MKKYKHENLQNFIILEGFMQNGHDHRNQRIEKASKHPFPSGLCRVPNNLASGNIFDICVLAWLLRADGAINMTLPCGLLEVGE